MRTEADGGREGLLLSGSDINKLRTEAKDHIANVDNMVMALHVQLSFMCDRHIHIHHLLNNNERNLNLEMMDIIHEIRQKLFVYEEKAEKLQKLIGEVEE